MEKDKDKGKKEAGADKNTALEADKAVWAEVTATVQPYDSAPQKPAQPSRKTRKTAALRPRSIAPPLPAAPRGARTLDGATARRLKRGQFNIDMKLDLHGMTREGAQKAVRSFILKCYEQKKRTVLIVTGRGTPSKGTGVLRTLLPQWLAEGDCGRVVLSCVPAHQKDGGTGAWYVRLARNPPQ
ncbi:MAG: Smr/MutS family protein [Alphaproteobacteria bacterium]|nr:Smr/MutS family protein [Alphaproteobacteria bacterium]